MTPSSFLPVPPISSSSISSKVAGELPPSARWTHIGQRFHPPGDPVRFRLKNASELMSFIEENSAIVDKQQLLDMYHQAVNDAPYSFFYVNMNAKNVNDMFLIRFEHSFKITNDEYIYSSLI